MDQLWQKVVVGASLAAVMLLLVANFLLLSILSEDEKTPVAAAEIPALKTPTSGNANRALAEELDRTGRRLQTPLERTLMEIQSMGSSTATLQSLPVLLEQMIAETEELSGVAPQFTASAKRLKSIEREFKRLSGYTEGLGGVLVDLEKTMQTMSADIARIRQCTEKPSSCG